MRKEAVLTTRMEDYLEAISILEEKKKYVRVKDIAKYMKVKMPSVTGALRSLTDRNLVNHEKYEYVELTEQGMVIAQDIRRRHDAILKFLTEILDIDPETAEEDSCRMEHAISSATLERLLKLVECLQECPSGTPKCLERYEYYVNHDEKPPPPTSCEEGDRANTGLGIPLSSLSPNTKGKIIRVSGRGPGRRRIMDMGIIPGAIVEVERVAPLGDPIEIKIKDYHLSLRKAEAAHIRVEALPKN